MRTRLSTKLNKVAQKSLPKTNTGDARNQIFGCRTDQEYNVGELLRATPRLLIIGPKFALTQKSNQQTEISIEIGIEKAIQSLRWKDHFRLHPPTTNTGPSTRLPRNFQNMSANQAPIADRTTEATFKAIKKRIQAAFKNKKYPGSQRHKGPVQRP